MACLTLALPSEAAQVSHKVHLIISGPEEFISIEFLLIHLCGLGCTIPKKKKKKSLKIKIKFKN